MQISNRIQQLFKNDQARIAYLMIGDGGIERTLTAALALIKGGVNMLELGIPFSDPIADGPVIQRAAMRALASHVTLQDILWLIQSIRCQSNIPLILFSYLNPILTAINLNFLQQAKQAGIDGLLIVDCPLEEVQTVETICHECDLNLIYVVTPSTSTIRMQKMKEHAQGFLYYACQTGTTGMRHTLPDNFQQKIQIIKSIFSLPVVVGFGISNREMTKQVLAQADGVVIGSYFVKLLEKNVSPATLSRHARDIYSSVLF